MPVASKGTVMSMKDVIRQKCKWPKPVLSATELAWTSAVKISFPIDGP